MFFLTPALAELTIEEYGASDGGGSEHNSQYWATGDDMVRFGSGQTFLEETASEQGVTGPGGWSEYSSQGTIGTGYQTDTHVSFDHGGVYGSAVSVKGMIQNKSSTYCNVAIPPSEERAIASFTGLAKGANISVSKFADGPNIGFSADAIGTGAMFRNSYSSTAVTGFNATNTTMNYANQIDRDLFRTANSTGTAITHVVWTKTAFSDPYNLTENATSFVK